MLCGMRERQYSETCDGCEVSRDPVEALRRVLVLKAEGVAEVILGGIYPPEESVIGVSCTDELPCCVERREPKGEGLACSLVLFGSENCDGVFGRGGRWNCVGLCISDDVSEWRPERAGDGFIIDSDKVSLNRLCEVGVTRLRGSLGSLIVSSAKSAGSIKPMDWLLFNVDMGICVCGFKSPR
jgi:hypothetical protein